jgi:membrane protein YqaA with SNARE-associated domain
MITEELQHLEEVYEKEVTGIVKKSGQLLRSKYGLWVLGAITFVDSALALPGPVDPFLAAYIMANRSRAFIAFIVTVLTSVLGGVMLYLFAAFFSEQLLQFLSPESLKTFNDIVLLFDKGTFTLSFLGSFTPIPYGFIVIAAGVLQGNFALFVVGSFLGRAIRYAVVAYLTYRYGEPALKLAKNNLNIASVVVIAAAVGYFLYHFLK